VIGQVKIEYISLLVKHSSEHRTCIKRKHLATMQR